MKILTTIIFVITTTSCYDLLAQSSASPYSVYGIGILKDRTSVLNRAMGGTGIAVRDPINLSNVNPASYTSIQNATQISDFGLYMETNRYTNSKQSSTYNTANINNLNLWVRLSKNWAGTVGIAPYSTVRYNIASKTTVGDNSTLVYSGKGGVTQYYLANALQVTKNLSVGLTVSFLHGSIDRKETITSGTAEGTEVSTLTYVNRGKLDIGAQYEFELGSEATLTLGAVYENRLRLNTSQEVTIYQQQDTLNSERKKVDDYILPQKFGSGIALRSKGSTFSVDLSYQQWSNAKLENDLRLRNIRRASFGYQYRVLGSDSFWSGVVFRTGAYFRENPIIVQGTSFNDWGVTVGFGVPVSNKRNSLNISYSYFQSGTLAKNLIQQQSQIISLDLTFRDLWGIKRKFD